MRDLLPMPSRLRLPVCDDVTDGDMLPVCRVHPVLNSMLLPMPSRPRLPVCGDVTDGDILPVSRVHPVLNSMLLPVSSRPPLPVCGDVSDGDILPVSRVHPVLNSTLLSVSVDCGLELQLMSSGTSDPLLTADALLTVTSASGKHNQSINQSIKHMKLLGRQLPMITGALQVTQ